MKVRLLLVVLGLAFSSAVPTFSQPTNTPDALAVAPQVREEIEAVFKKFQEVYNKHDAAALYTEDAVEVRG